MFQLHSYCDKMPWQKATQVRIRFLPFTSPGCTPSSRTMQDRNFKQLDTSHPQFKQLDTSYPQLKIERNEHVCACWLVLREISPLLYSVGPLAQGMVPPTAGQVFSHHLIKAVPHRQVYRTTQCGQPLIETVFPGHPILYQVVILTTYSKVPDNIRNKHPPVLTSFSINLIQGRVILEEGPLIENSPTKLTCWKGRGIFS